MDPFQLLMQQHWARFASQNNFEDVVKQYKNKNFLLKRHEDHILRSEFGYQGFLTYLKTTTTTARPSNETKPSTTIPLHKKNCVALNDLLKSIDKPIAGKFLLCRTICPPAKIVALFTIVDDPDGILGVQIALYNFVHNAHHQQPADVYQYLPVGTILAIMNPWFKKTADGGLTVRCDNPAEVVILTNSRINEIFGSVTWKGEIPIKYRQQMLKAGDSTVDWKASGNEHFAQKRFTNAVEAYTKGIDDAKVDGKSKLDLLANRSAAYTALKKYNLALDDAESVLIVDRNHIKCIFRKTKALFGLAQYQNALTFLNDSAARTLSKQHQTIVNDLIAKAKALIAQSQTGVYPWLDIFRSKCDEIAEYTGPVIVKNTATKGRGLFATEPIKAGRLIIASRAVARGVGNIKNEMLFNMRINERTGEKYLNDYSQTQLITELVHILKENPDKCDEVYNLFAGPEFSSVPMGSHGTEIDLERIEAICFYNQFGNNISDTEKHCGLWLSPSYINHSCVDGSSAWSMKNDFLFVFAFRDIAANEEILISYSPPLQPMAQALKARKFVCDCRLCNRDLQDTKEIQEKRSYLVQQLTAILKKYGDGKDLDRICVDIKDDEHKWTMILESLDTLRIDAPELNFCYLKQIHLIARIYFRNEQFSKSVTALEKMYNIIANVPAFSNLCPDVCADLIGCYVMLGRLSKVKEWSRSLKRYLTTSYGSWKVIETILPYTQEILQDIGVSLNEV